MSHLLVLSLEYLRYKKDATIRVYADDRFLEEFTLTQDIKLKTVDANKTWRYGWTGPQNFSLVVNEPDKLFVIRIDERYLQDRIRIEIVNANNNYTNGFMTKFSYIRMHHMFIIPERFLQSSIWELLERYDAGRSSVGFGRYYKQREKTIWPTNMLRPTNSLTNESGSLRGKTIGGNFWFECKLYRKHQMIHIGKPNPGRYFIHWHLFRLLWAFKLLNIYT